MCAFGKRSVIYVGLVIPATRCKGLPVFMGLIGLTPSSSCQRILSRSWPCTSPIPRQTAADHLILNQICARLNSRKSLAERNLSNMGDILVPQDTLEFLDRGGSASTV